MKKCRGVVGHRVITPAFDLDVDHIPGLGFRLLIDWGHPQPCQDDVIALPDLLLRRDLKVPENDVPGGGVGPVPGALDHVALHEPSEHHDDPNLMLSHAAPEVRHGVMDWALEYDIYLLISQCIYIT